MQIGYLTLGVLDHPRAVAFYRDTLGLTLVNFDEGFQFASFQAGAIRFAVLGGEEVKQRRGGKAEHHTGIGFVVPDVDAAYRDLAAKGVRFTMPPSKQPWGGYMAMFADPDGNVFYLDGSTP
jgi:predicted enzyme related to lactoylglutathione lyase